jgi:sporulation integral membrane protein YtvI
MKPSSLSIERLAAFTVVGAGALLLLRFYLTPLVLAALPFAFAWILAYLARPLALRLHRRMHLPLGATSAVLVFLALGLAGTGLFLLARRAVLELISLGERLAEDGVLEGITADLFSWWEGLSARFPFLSALSPDGGGMLGDLAQNAVTEGLSALGDLAVRAATSLVSALPGWSLFVLVTLVAAFYFAVDLGGIHGRLLAVMPPKLREFAKRVKESVWSTAVGYLRAYLLLMLVTFLVLLVGFLVLRVDYALLLAALFALLDFLPIIGIEILLLPWGAFAAFTGNLPLGIGLLLLYGLLTLLRQFLEPRLVGRHLGLHPLLALVSMYAGLRLFGFLGLMLLPGALLVVRNVLQKNGSQTAEPINR